MGHLLTQPGWKAQCFRR